MSLQCPPFSTFHDTRTRAKLEQLLYGRISLPTYIRYFLGVCPSRVHARAFAMASDTEMADVAAPRVERESSKPTSRSEKSSKHSSKDKERSSRDDHKSRSAKEHKHKHKSKDKDKDQDRERRSNGDRRNRNGSRERDRHRSSRHDAAVPSGRAEAEPGELAPEALLQQNALADRDAADGTRAEADEFLRREEASMALPPPPQPLPPPPARAAMGPSDAEAGLPPLTGDVNPGGATSLPPGFEPQTCETGGEVSMSVEETNRCGAHGAALPG